MNVEIAALADYANIAQGDKLNISGIFNAIWVKDFPAIHPSMVLAAEVNTRPRWLDTVAWWWRGQIPCDEGA